MDKRIRRNGSALLLLLLAGCSGTPPETLGGNGEQLAPCPDSPNCVSSHPADGAAPWTLAEPAGQAWPKIRQQVAALPRTTLVTVSENYLHAESRSRVFGFVDDLELLLQPETQQLQWRSASRLGYSDLGVNQARIDTLAGELEKNAVITLSIRDDS